MMPTHKQVLRPERNARSCSKVAAIVRVAPIPVALQPSRRDLPRLRGFLRDDSQSFETRLQA